jgi:hypothetical protein
MASPEHQSTCVFIPVTPVRRPSPRSRHLVWPGPRNSAPEFRLAIGRPIRILTDWSEAYAAGSDKPPPGRALCSLP